MLKFFILLISSLLFFNACSIKNPLSKKSKITYIDCPKTLILAPGSKISNDQFTMTLNKNYSTSCYLPEPESNEVVFEYNYSIETTFNNPSAETEKFEFIIFITNKTEDTKVHEETFIKDIEINLPECFLSITCVSVAIKDLTISNCKFFLIFSPTLIIVAFAR